MSSKEKIKALEDELHALNGEVSAKREQDKGWCTT